MEDFKHVIENNKETLDTVQVWCSELYNSKFSNFFEYPRKLSERLNSNVRSITDQELEEILSSLPLKLFDASETLSQCKLNVEVLKLKVKDKSREVAKSSSEKTDSKRNEEGEIAVLGDKLLIACYSSVVDRVERELTYCRELIMSAKKIWDARRRTEDINPVTPQDYSKSQSIPDYNVSDSKVYVK